jgi:hypothetical protein
MATKEEKKPVTDAVLKKLLPKGYTLDKAIGPRADLLKSVIIKESEIKKVQDKELEPLTEFKKAMQEWFIENLSINDGAVGANYMAKIEMKHYIEVTDVEEFLKFVLKKKAYHLLKSDIVSSAAVFEMLEAGDKVPGTTARERKTLSLTKAGKTKKPTSGD